MAEAKQLSTLFKHTFWADNRSPANVRRMLKHTPLTVSAWDGKQLVGFARVLTDFTYRAVLYDVVVDPAYRGRGIGKEMLRQLHEHPKLKRVDVWYLSTRDAHGLYEKFGWQRNSKDFMKWRRTPAAEKAS